MRRNRTDGSSGGNRTQSAVAQREGRGDHHLRARGLILRGVVIATYVQLDGTRAVPESTSQNITGVYCDVLVYSSIEGFKNGPLKGVPVVQNVGMHTGNIWIPRATRQDLSQLALKIATADPVNLDGDHVLIQFLEDDLSRPIITGRYLHPRMGQGNEGLDSAGHRMKLKVTDGEPYLWKHAGAYFGVDKDGNFVIDTTRAHSGQYDASGNEVPADNAANGNVNLILNNQATLTVTGVDSNGANVKFSLSLLDNQLIVQLDGGDSLAVIGKDGATTMQVGDGAKHVAIVEALEALYGDGLSGLFQWLATHVHPTGVGPSGPSTAPPPAWDPAINSSKVSIPDG